MHTATSSCWKLGDIHMVVPANPDFCMKPPRLEGIVLPCSAQPDMSTCVWWLLLPLEPDVSEPVLNSSRTGPKPWLKGKERAAGLEGQLTGVVLLIWPAGVTAPAWWRTVVFWINQKIRQ